MVIRIVMRNNVKDAGACSGVVLVSQIINDRGSIEFRVFFDF